MNRWSRLWRRSRLEDELEKELRFQLDQHASDLIARGHTAAQAQCDARIALGGPGQVKQSCRDARRTRWAEDLLQDTRYAHPPASFLLQALVLSMDAPFAPMKIAQARRRFAGDRSAVGRNLIFDGKNYVVIGVAPPGFQLSGKADVLTPLGQSTDPRMQNRKAAFIKVVARLAPGVTLNQAQEEISLINRRLAREYPRSDGGVRMLVRPFMRDLVKDVRGTLWLLLSAVGLGVRMALGASAHDVMWLVLRQSLRMIAVGVGPGHDRSFGGRPTFAAHG